jgi:hypothetical protein
VWSFIVLLSRARPGGLWIGCYCCIAQLAERSLLLGAPTLLFGASRNGVLLFWIVAALALATVVTVAQRIVHVAHTAGATPVRTMRPRDTLPGHAPALQSRKGT